MSRPLARAVVPRGRPFADPACAGCTQLGLFRALRRAGLEVRGASGCEPAGGDLVAPPAGPWAAVAGAARVLADAAGALGSAAGAGARLLVLADRDGASSRRAARLLARAVPRTVGVDCGDPLALEAAVREAARAPGAALVALTPCPRLARRAEALAVAPSRCNRCGACLTLGCPALSDGGGEAMEVDRAACSGCAQCVALCRGGALGPRRP